VTRIPNPTRFLGLLPLAALVVAGSADAAPGDRRQEACTKAGSQHERMALGCFRLRAEPSHGATVHGGVTVQGFFATKPATRETSTSRASQRRRDWLRARERSEAAQATAADP
jgi:hypothetical protein